MTQKEQGAITRSRSAGLIAVAINATLVISQQWVQPRRIHGEEDSLLTPERDEARTQITSERTITQLDLVEGWPRGIMYFWR